MKYKKRIKCRWCNGKKLHKILDLWNMPLAWWFLKKEKIYNEQKIPLDLYFCEECKLVQILNIIDPKVLFQKYFYISSIIPDLKKHFQTYYTFLINNYLINKWDKLLEIWCNDWVLLENFINNDSIFTLWIEPSENVSKLAKNKWLNIINDFFNLNTAKDILNKYWSFNVLTWSNMFAHIDDIVEIIKSAKIILKKEGVFIFEVHYLLDLLKENQYDTIYHEHLTYYSVLAIKNIFIIYWMKIIDVIHLDMHGWWIRVVTCFEDSKHNIKKSVNNFIKEEISYWLENLNNYLDFWKKVLAHKKELVNLLNKLKNNWSKIVWYGAPWRWTILLNYCGINDKILDYIVDISPLRQGMLMPWVHIPIKNPEKLDISSNDYILILAWNYSNSIIEQEKDIFKKWVKFIIPFPKIKIL